MVIGLGNDLLVSDGEIIIVFAALHLRRIESGTEFDALDRRDPENDGSDPVFHPVEHGISQPGGHPEGTAFDDAAQRIPFIPGGADGFRHLDAGQKVHHRQRHFLELPEPVGGREAGVEGFVPDVADLKDVGTDPDPFCF